MMCGDKVYSLKNKQIGIYRSTTKQSGFMMINVDYENDLKDTEYPQQLISLDEKYRNDDLWRMVESDILPKGTIIEDQDKNQMIFTGKAFQIYYSKLDDNEKFIGFCKGDLWEIIDVDEKELENTMG